jgi:5'(3')-deoxyribonucleotidase
MTLGERDLFAVDIDGVACDHAEAVCNYVGKAYGLNCTPSEVVSWNHDFGGITFPQAGEQSYPDPDFILGMKVTNGFAGFLSELSKMFRVVLCSARKPYCHKATRQWVNNNFGDQEVAFVADKRKVRAAFLIDDYEKEVLRFAESGGIAFLLKRPWNDNEAITKALSGYANCHRVSSFAEVLEMLKPSALRHHGEPPRC